MGQQSLEITPGEIESWINQICPWSVQSGAPGVPQENISQPVSDICNHKVPKNLVLIPCPVKLDLPWFLVDY